MGYPKATNTTPGGSERQFVQKPILEAQISGDLPETRIVQEYLKTLHSTLQLARGHAHHGLTHPQVDPRQELRNVYAVCEKVIGPQPPPINISIGMDGQLRPLNRAAKRTIIQ